VAGQCQVQGRAGDGPPHPVASGKGPRKALQATSGPGRAVECTRHYGLDKDTENSHSQ